VIVLVRIDERLIHGQVVVGWGAHLRPDRYVVVDRRLAETEWEQELYELVVPDGVAAEFVGPDQALGRMDEWKNSPERVVVLVRNLEGLLPLVESGHLAGWTVNLGGIHFSPGRAQVLSYVHLDSVDLERLRRLERSEVDLEARDLPVSVGVPIAALIERGIAAWRV